MTTNATAAVLHQRGGALEIEPVALAADVVAKASEHHDWEEFSRMKLLQGAPLQRYYPLHADAWPEYEAWRKGRAAD